MIRLELFTDFDTFIEWIDSEELLVTVAGANFTFPPTTRQLQAYIPMKKLFVQCD